MNDPYMEGLYKRIIQTRVRIRSFRFAHCMYYSYNHGQNIGSKMQFSYETSYETTIFNFSGFQFLQFLIFQQFFARL